MPPKPHCPVHVSATMKLREHQEHRHASGPYDEPNAKERPLYWRCEVAGCYQVKVYQRVTPQPRAHCIHCGGTVDTANRHLISVCKKCRNRQRQARFLAQKKKQLAKPLARADEYQRTKQPGIRI